MFCRVRECFSLRVKGRVVSYTPSSKVVFIADEYVNDYVLRYVIPIKEPVIEPEPVVEAEPVKVSKRGRPSNGDRASTDTITKDEQSTDETEQATVYTGTSND